MSTNGNETGRPALVDAQTTVRHFLEAALPEVQRIDVTRVTRTEAGETAWEAEADVWQPNPTLRSLGIETQRPVLDHQRYFLRLDALLNVLAYELESAGR
ncbi:MAG TPA: hypothetical protein VJL29_12450 [Thermoguttaceae bacterium]|nr:hypothetical protein [Thermoguttaceae bacterium]